MSAPPTDGPGLPHVLAVAWGIEVAPQRGPRRELTHERIVEAAIALADVEGIGAVTMQRLAETLGYTTMALYRYVGSKDDLQALMQDAAVAELEPVTADPADWRTGLREWASLLRRRYAAHPWLLDLDPTPVVLLMPGNLRVVDRAFGLLRPLGLDDGRALDAISALALLVRGYARIERDFVARPAVIGPGGVAAIQGEVSQARFPALAPLVASGAYFGAMDASDPDSEHVPDPWGAHHAFEALLDGLAQRAR